jgi:hypothetical protein
VTGPKYAPSRYGAYNLCYQNRKGLLCFINKKTYEEFIMDPRDIATSEELIGEFDAPQAFYIGLLAGSKMNTPVENYVSKALKKSHLYVIR